MGLRGHSLMLIPDFPDQFFGSVTSSWRSTPTRCVGTDVPSVPSGSKVRESAHAGDHTKAIAYCTRATELDPDYALALSSIAQMLGASLFNGDASPSVVLPRFREVAADAVQTAPDTAEA